MEFTSFNFLTLFLPVTILVGILCRGIYRNVTLIVLSLAFYAWGNPYALCVLLGVTILNFFAARHRNGQTIAIILNILTLISYKYTPGLSFPLGLSFYTFQVISYQIDVRRGYYPAERNFISFLLYVSFFPKMITGPIARYKSFPTDFCTNSFNINNFTGGLERFLLGFGKKVLIADVAAIVANCVFDAPYETIPTLYCWLGAIAYTIQIFFDFSGYTDMAIGLGRMLGYSLPENFNYPYSSKSVQEFWRRWHISLSSWFKDYLYIPLGGNRKGKLREYANMFIVFLLCGAWHGATLPFVIWGAYHGLGITIEKAGFKQVLKKMPSTVCNIYTMLFVIIGWVLFRAPTVGQAFIMIKHMFSLNESYPYYTFTSFYHIFDISSLYILAGGFVLSYPVAGKVYSIMNNNLRLLFLLLVFIVSYIFSITAEISPSIYGQF